MAGTSTDIVELTSVTGTPDERLAAIIDGVLLTVDRSLPRQRMALSLMIQPVFAQVEREKEESPPRTPCASRRGPAARRPPADGKANHGGHR